MDETGVTTVPNKTPKVIAPKGKKNVRRIVSGERGQLITAVCCLSAVGNYIPPALIFTRKRQKPELMNGAPSGSILMISDSGYMNTDLFLKWFQHLHSVVRSSPEQPILLILDNHTSHISLEATLFCRRNGIHVISLPPHISHKTQPLDVGIYGPLKKVYAEEADTWQISNPGRSITQFQVAEIFAKSYNRPATLDKAVKSFQKTGIWPYDQNIFSEEDFAPSEVTDRPLTENNENNPIGEIISVDTTSSEETKNQYTNRTRDYNTSRINSTNRAKRPRQGVSSRKCHNGDLRCFHFTRANTPIHFQNISHSFEFSIY
jgi:hypothetical protein